MDFYKDPRDGQASKRLTASLRAGAEIASYLEEEPNDAHAKLLMREILDTINRSNSQLRESNRKRHRNLVRQREQQVLTETKPLPVVNTDSDK